VGRARAGKLVYDARPTHQHWHFTQFAAYSLLDKTKTLVVRSHKQGFCIEDVYDPSGVYVRGQPGRYHCGDMGITAHYADLYRFDVPGQWVDVTDVPPGEYVLEVEVNPSKDPRFGEPAPWLQNDVARVRVRIPPTS